jgi:hypothetical protein
LGGTIVNQWHVEAAYLEKRLEASLKMALAASGECARIAHQGLAELYAKKLASLKAPVPTKAPSRLAGPKLIRTASRAASALNGTLTLRSFAMAS